MAFAVYSRCSLLLYLFVLIFKDLCLAIPLRGNYPWTILLCKYGDIAHEPYDKQYIYNWLYKNREGSLNRYFTDISGGVYTIRGSNVVSWFSLPYSRDHVATLAEQDPKLDKYGSSHNHKLYHKTKELCIKTAFAQRKLPRRQNGRTGRRKPRINTVTIINHGNFALFCSEKGILLTPNYVMTSALAHEIVHSMHIGHSFSDRAVKVYPHAKVGEYDDKFDLMSTSNAFMYNTTFGMNGPGLIGPHLDYLGWIPHDKLLFFGSKGSGGPGVYEVQCLGTQSRLNRPLAHQLILIPYDRDNHLNVYTVEFRCTSAPHNRGLPTHSVVIHKLITHSNTGPKKNQPHIYSYLMTKPLAEVGNQAYGWQTGEEYYIFLNTGRDYSLRLTVDHIDRQGQFAQIRLESSFDPQKCVRGEVQRAAFDGDTTCVTRAEAELIRRQNQAHSANWDHATRSCRNGSVYRAAGPRDLVCVTTAERIQADQQGLKQEAYEAFFRRPTFGLNACRDGLVWRLIDNFDYVCVSKERKAAVDAQTRAHPSRKNTDGNCLAGYIYREAFPGDLVCVLPNERDDAVRDSNNSKKYLLYPRFFNGDDSVDTI